MYTISRQISLRNQDPEKGPVLSSISLSTAAYKQALVDSEYAPSELMFICGVHLEVEWDLEILYTVSHELSELKATFILNSEN